MKKLLLLLVLIANVATAQVKTVTISEKKIGPFWCKFTADVKLSNTSDSTYFMWIGFQNYKYQYISDIHSVGFIVYGGHTCGQLREFCNILNKAKETVGTEVMWESNKQYTIQTYGFIRKVYIGDNEDAYNYMSPSQVDKFIAWIDSIGIDK